MSSIESGGIDAFVNSFPAEGADANQQTPDVSQATPPVVQPQGTEGAPNAEQSLIEQAKIDLSGLPEEQQIYLRQREREMQGHMTRRLQEATDARREAEQSLAFLNALNSDPNFAYQVLSQIQSNLAAAGYDVGGYDPNDQWTGDPDEFGMGQGPDPYVQQEIASLRAENEQIQQYFVEQQLASQLDTQLNQIKANHPDWGDAEIGAIIDMGYATGGNLLAAAEQFEAINDSVISRYLQSKSNVQTPAPLPNAQGVGAQVPAPKTDDELRAAAMERIRNAFS